MSRFEWGILISIRQDGRKWMVGWMDVWMGPLQRPESKHDRLTVLGVGWEWEVICLFSQSLSQSPQIRQQNAFGNVLTIFPGRLLFSLSDLGLIQCMSYSSRFPHLASEQQRYLMTGETASDIRFANFSVKGAAAIKWENGDISIGSVMDLRRSVSENRG